MECALSYGRSMPASYTCTVLQSLAESAINKAVPELPATLSLKQESSSKSFFLPRKGFRA